MSTTIDQVEHGTAVSSGMGYGPGYTPECECGWAESPCATVDEAVERIEAHLAIVQNDKPSRRLAQIELDQPMTQRMTEHFRRVAAAMEARRGVGFGAGAQLRMDAYLSEFCEHVRARNTRRAGGLADVIESRVEPDLREHIGRHMHDPAHVAVRHHDGRTYVLSWWWSVRLCKWAADLHDGDTGDLIRSTESPWLARIEHDLGIA